MNYDRFVELNTKKPPILKITLIELMNNDK